MRRREFTTPTYSFILTAHQQLWAVEASNSYKYVVILFLVQPPNNYKMAIINHSGHMAMWQISARGNHVGIVF